MAKNRMAGEKLDEPTQESADAKEALSNSARNKQIREEIGNDPERMSQRISGVDREKYDFDGYTDKQINMALQGESFGDKDYERLTGKSLGGDDSKPKEPEVSIPTPVESTPTPEVKPEAPTYTPPKPDYQGIGGGFGVGGQNINQNNDITSTVTGDNNTVTNTQDNSIRGFGGASAAARSKFLRDRYVADVSRFVGA
jgi:hypothetical protein